MITKCRICGNSDLKIVLDLGNHSLSCRFPFNYEHDPLISPLILLKCNDETNNCNCGLVQLGNNIPNDELYMHNYGYRSGLNNTMMNHLKNLGNEILARTMINDDDVILDIGSNDATLLKSYNVNNKIIKIGIDPTGLQFKKFYTNDILLVPEYFSSNAFLTKLPDKKAKIVTSISMFYDLPKPQQFMLDIKRILHEEGVWITEQSYIVSMLNTYSFDTVCHEHLEYYSLKQIEHMANLCELRIIDVLMNDCNGGSFRIYLTHLNNSHKVNCENIQKLKSIENEMKLNTTIPYEIFNNNCDLLKQNLCKFLKDMKRCGKSIYIYGASTKGNTLLQYFDIDNKIISGAAERNIDKIGRRTPKTDIPIISEEEMREKNPDFLLILPWHFRDEFVTREGKFLENGGQLIFPLPTFEVYTTKKVAFITGISGQIGKYLSDILLENNYIVYGLLHNNVSNLNKRINYIYGDLNDVNLLKEIINTINPDEIYNLGGETDTPLSVKFPVECFDINARILFTICETIKNSKKQIKLFQANSAELYKGIQYEDKLIVNENTLHFHPITPYSISKLASYWTIRYYREHYNLYMCNGILFTTESPYRNDRYLIKKITNFIKSFNDGDILKLGNLYNNRDYIHAKDAANGIYLMMNQNESSDYILSSEKSHNIKEIVNLCFKLKNMHLRWEGEGYNEKAYDSNSNKLLVEINKEFYRTYEKLENLVGDCSKIKNIGWDPSYDIVKIIEEMFV